MEIPEDVRARREAAVQAHIKAEAEDHDVAGVLASFHHPRYEVPAMAATADGPSAVEGLVGTLLGAFPDFFVKQDALYHADNAVIVECRFGGTQQGVWAGIPPTGKRAEVQAALILLFEGADMICEKVYFDHGTMLQQLNGHA